MVIQDCVKGQLEYSQPIADNQKVDSAWGRV